MKNDDLIYMTASEAAALFRKRKLSPVELMSAVIERAEEVEPKINAFTFKHYDEAMDLAKAAEAKFMKKGTRVGALEGLPIAIKDESWIAGKPTSYGSLTVGKDFIPDKTSVNNERILKAGGIVGDWPTLKRQALFEDRDLYPALDLRALEKGLLAEHLGLDRRALDTLVFPESASVRPLTGLV